MKQVYTTTLRLNLEKEADREAWGHLRWVDRKQYHSVNSAVIAAVNAYFSRKEQLEEIGIQVTYCQLETEMIRRFTKDYSFEELDQWFQGLIHEYVKWAEYLYRHTMRRNESLRDLAFPYAYRTGQEHQHRPRNQRPTQGRTGTQHWTLPGAFNLQKKIDKCTH